MRNIKSLSILISILIIALTLAASVSADTEVIEEVRDDKGRLIKGVYRDEDGTLRTVLNEWYPDTEESRLKRTRVSRKSTNPFLDRYTEEQYSWDGKLTFEVQEERNTGGELLSGERKTWKIVDGERTLLLEEEWDVNSRKWVVTDFEGNEENSESPSPTAPDIGKEEFKNFTGIYTTTVAGRESFFRIRQQRDVALLGWVERSNGDWKWLKITITNGGEPSSYPLRGTVVGDRLETKDWARCHAPDGTSTLFSFDQRIQLFSGGNRLFISDQEFTCEDGKVTLIPNMFRALMSLDRIE